MKLFKLVRDEDVSGVSGTGVVAEICVFKSGKVCVSFLPHTANVSNVIVYDSLEDAEKVHGHNGLTRVVKYE
jgi:hypothetical protein